MSELHTKLLLILDDRELVDGDVRGLVGHRRFGDIIFKRKPLIDHFREALPAWARDRFIRLRGDEDIAELRKIIEGSGEDTSAFVISSRAGFPQSERLAQLIERLPYAQEDFTDSLYNPLLIFLCNAHAIVDQWPAFVASPMHTWENTWQKSQRLQSMRPLDLGEIRDFLSFTSNSTSTRHFNEVQIDSYYYTKSSNDKHKMLAEYSFYNLVPERMRPWLIQPFEYRDEGERASYKMLRYYLADAALQWVHGAFESDTFEAFVNRLLFFIADRPKRSCDRQQSSAMAREIFVDKLERRVKDFLGSDDGRRINHLACSANPQLDISLQFERYLGLYRHYEKGFAFDHCAVGHGDPCFSNVLYEQQRYLMKLIDPKGAVSEDDLWTHPLYDLCKISHSVLGDYDFINNGLYTVGFSDANDLVLSFKHTNHGLLKPLFSRQIKEMGHDIRMIRLGEASLFLSMLPLHLDYPNKVIAFMLKARQILDEVESE